MMMTMMMVMMMMMMMMMMMIAALHIQTQCYVEQASFNSGLEWLNRLQMELASKGSGLPWRKLAFPMFQAVILVN